MTEKSQYTEKRSLSCKLSDEELLEAGDNLATLNHDYSNVDNEKKADAAKYTAKLNDLKAEIDVISLKISAKQELRDVECIVHIYPKAHRKEVERTDTNVVIAKEKLAQTDLQYELQFAEDQKDKE